MTRLHLTILPAILALIASSCSEQTEQSGPLVDPDAWQRPGSGSDVDTPTYHRIIRDESRLVIVDFHADWCAPCKILAPTLQKVAGDHPDEVFLIKVNVDNNQKLAGEIGVQSIPFVQFYKDGRAVDQFIGVVPEERILEMVRKHATRS